MTLLALAAALAPHVGPFRLTAPQPDVRRTSRIRLLLSVSYLIVALGFYPDILFSITDAPVLSVLGLERVVAVDGPQMVSGEFDPGQ